MDSGLLFTHDISHLLRYGLRHNRGHQKGARVYAPIVSLVLPNKKLYHPFGALIW